MVGGVSSSRCSSRTMCEGLRSMPAGFSDTLISFWSFSYGLPTIGEKKPKIPASSPGAWPAGYCSRIAFRWRLSRSSQKRRIARKILTTIAAVPIAAFAPVDMPPVWIRGGVLVGNPEEPLYALLVAEEIDVIVDPPSGLFVVTGAYVTPELT